MSIKSSWRVTESSSDNGRINWANDFQVKEVLQVNNILISNVPANMTRFYRPLDLTMNGSAKRFIAKKFNGWYLQQISDELDYVEPLEKIDVKLRLWILKSLHAA